MTRVRCLLLLTLSLLLVGFVSKQQGLTVSPTAAEIQQPVEQQTVGGASQPDYSLWVVNPTSGSRESTLTLNTPPSTHCPWDADDTFWFNAGGSVLQPGGSFTISKCFIADAQEHLTGVITRWDGKQGVESKITIQTASGLSWTAHSTAYVQVGFGRGEDGHKLCISLPDYDAPAETNPKLLPIEGSNGGVGMFGVATWTVTNLGNQRARNISLDGKLFASVSDEMNKYCPGGFPPPGTPATNCEGRDPRVCKDEMN